MEHPTCATTKRCRASRLVQSCAAKLAAVITASLLLFVRGQLLEMDTVKFQAASYPRFGCPDPGMCYPIQHTLQPGHFVAWCGWCCTGCLSYAVQVSEPLDVPITVNIMKVDDLSEWGTSRYNATYLNSTNTYDSLACRSQSSCKAYANYLSSYGAYCVVVTTPYVIMPSPPPPPTPPRPPQPPSTPSAPGTGGGGSNNGGGSNSGGGSSGGGSDYPGGGSDYPGGFDWGTVDTGTTPAPTATQPVSETPSSAAQSAWEQILAGLGGSRRSMLWSNPLFGILPGFYATSTSNAQAMKQQQHQQQERDARSDSRSSPCGDGIAGNGGGGFDMMMMQHLCVPTSSSDSDAPGDNKQECNGGGVMMRQLLVSGPSPPPPYSPPPPPLQSSRDGVNVTIWLQVRADCKVAEGHNAAGRSIVNALMLIGWSGIAAILLLLI